jgi:hypothetical protein
MPLLLPLLARPALPPVAVMFLITLLSVATTDFAASLVMPVTPAARSSRSSAASRGFSGRRQLMDYKSNNAR